MTSVLAIACSPAGARSASGTAGDLLLERLRARDPDIAVVRRDLGVTLPAFVDAGFAAAMLVTEGERTAGQTAALAESECLIAELEATDLLVLSTPMHNFTVPAVLKAWIDQVLRVERTFRRTPAGKVGGLRDRPTYVVVASGGRVIGDLARQPDFLTPYLTAVLATLGIRTVRFLHLEGLGADPAKAAGVAAETRAWLDAQLPLPRPATLSDG
jgi:FMN-dependent NADH-azoreductase